jgi:hypothetical protein
MGLFHLFSEVNRQFNNATALHSSRGNSRFPARHRRSSAYAEPNYFLPVSNHSSDFPNYRRIAGKTSAPSLLRLYSRADR